MKLIHNYLTKTNQTISFAESMTGGFLYAKSFNPIL